MAVDKAHTWTDAELRRLEKRIKVEYTKAYNEIKKEMQSIMAKINATPDMTAEKRMLEAHKYARLKTLCEQISETLKDTNKTAQKFISKSMQNIYKTNYNFSAERLGFSLIDNTAVKNILTGKVNPFTELAIARDNDISVMMRSFESEMTTALLKGESIPKIANRLKTVAEKYLIDSIKIARTETTRIENSARQSVGDEGVRLGFNMWKRWVATGDARTRDEHLSADGQEVPNDEPFEIGGEQLMFPGDESLGASGWNTINCRCTMVSFVKENDNKKYSNKTMEEEKERREKKR